MKYFIYLMFCFLTCSGCNCSAFCPLDQMKEKIFNLPGEIQDDGENTYMHYGNNVWINLRYDDLDPIPPGLSMAYEKKWRCPYCYYWWSYGSKCTNPDCPTNQWMY